MYIHIFSNKDRLRKCERRNRIEKNLRFIIQICIYIQKKVFEDILDLRHHLLPYIIEHIY